MAHEVRFSHLTRTSVKKYESLAIFTLFTVFQNHPEKSHFYNIETLKDFLFLPLLVGHFRGKLHFYPLFFGSY